MTNRLSIQTTYDTEDMQSDSGVALPDDLTAGNLHELNISRDNTTDPSGSKASTGASVAGARPAMSQASTAGVQGWQTMSRRNGKGNVGPSRFMAYDAQGNAHVKAATSTSRSESESSDDTTTHASTTVNNQPERNFPRIRTEQFATPIPVTNGGRNVNYDSDDDDDDDDDDDSYFTI